jgi:hypothetical protein
MKKVLHCIAGLCLLSPTLGFTKTWDFDVFMDGKQIGTHQFVLSEKENSLKILRSEAKFDVKFLGINFYHYYHQADEVWENNCLKKVNAETQENSKVTTITGFQDFQDKPIFKVLSKKTQEIPSECIMTFAYWNSKILQQPKLLNPQTGEFLAVNISTIGKESILVKGLSVNAEHFKIDTKKFKLDVWYDVDGEWLALQSQTTDGRIDYVLK